MTKKRLSLLLVASLLTVGVIFAWSPSISSSVSVVFVGYTNQTYGFSKQYTSAWFRIENHSPYMLLCRQGSLDIERAGVWQQNTNWVGHQYDPIVEPGQSLTLSLMAPSDATRWRSSFLLTKMSTHSSLYWDVRFRFELFMDRLRLYRFGFRGQPWKEKEPSPAVVTSRVLEL